MLLFLSKYPQFIAWFFAGAFYAELLLSPAAAKAAPIRAISSTALRYQQDDWKRAIRPSFDRPLAGQQVAIPSSTVLPPATFFPFGNATGKQGSPAVQRAAATAESVSGNIKEQFASHDGGPGQPETQSFSSVNNTDMVDLFTGDFSYNIPLMDVGGYPLSLSYRGGISMDQEASWVGLGWNINPGTINRNLRGLPDDFDGKYDSIRKTMSMKENRTVGVTAGASAELKGLPLNLSASRGLFHNNYKGWGLENSLNASINAGIGAGGQLSGGLSVTNNTQEGFTVAPSMSVISSQIAADENSSVHGSFSLSLPYNSRSGMKGLQLSAGIRQYIADGQNQTRASDINYLNSQISFAGPSFIPSITIPFTSRQFSFTAKTGVLKKVFDANFFISGYVSSQFIADSDTAMGLPAFGYLNYQRAGGNASALLDFNFEKDLPYREKPPVPHIAIPYYTYDAFSITGEGTGGMFRAYRGDIGFVYDHAMRTRDVSDRVSLDFAGGDLVHGGVDLNINRAYSQNGSWMENNTLRDIIGFRKDTLDFEAAYFRNPAEKSMNSKKFYETIGGDDLVAVKLFQPNSNSSFIQATNYLTRYRNKRVVGEKLLKADSVYKPERDKRAQVISYLTAHEAETAGLTKYIESYNSNVFDLSSCGMEAPLEVPGGLYAYYYNGVDLEGSPAFRIDTKIDFLDESLVPPLGIGQTGKRGRGYESFSVRWVGRIRPPLTGRYIFQVLSDDGVKVSMRDSTVLEQWNDHPANPPHTFSLDLIGGEFYDLKIEYYEKSDRNDIQFNWQLPGATGYTVVGTEYLYFPAIDTFRVADLLVKEKRINSFRKPNHLSEISVLNNDGRRYVYGIPVYNLRQKEASFSVNPANALTATGLVRYSETDNSTQNQQGNNHYYSAEEVPAYAHSFLLTGILSPDYIDASGNGISDDDPGDAVKFNYSRVAGLSNPFKWRIPYAADSVNYNEGLKTDRRDDKGSYVAGEKELWYLHSIESKTMVATFTTESRTDLLAIDDRGNKLPNTAARRLKEINLYSKADFAKNGEQARPIKTVHFEYSYELCRGLNADAVLPSDSGKLTLKKVWFTYNKNDKGKLNPYVFHYNNNQRYQQKSYDRWGNYKHPSQNPGSGPSEIVGNDEYPYSIQDSAIAAANAGTWMLDSIYLPSGGSIKVDYESDDYAYVQHKRAMSMIRPVGFAAAPNLTAGFDNSLYASGQDHNYIYFDLPEGMNKQQFYRRYLQDVEKIYFRLLVAVPGDAYGSGSEYVSGYADLAEYGLSNSTTAWIRLAGISLKGDGAGDYSPMVKAAVQFLRLNLSSKAYPGSEPGSDLTPAAAVKMLAASFNNIATAFSSFDAVARNNGWVRQVDLNRSYIRLNNPDFNKLGGGHRVKRIRTYDNWNKMVQRRGAVYGQEYIYTIEQEIEGQTMTISSGVASYEPGIGGEENPFRQPIEYVDKAAVLGPVTLGYSEEPLGEAFFPSPSVGYRSVKVRTIHHADARSANGYEETRFYTTYDYPTYTDRSLIDRNTKKRFKPALANLLRINARHHLALTQGFKIELNDMNGKLRSQASYAETDLQHPIVYTENIYKTEDLSADLKRLDNTAMVIFPDGSIDSAGIIGKDAELMVALREQLSVNAGYNVNVNGDLFTIPFFPPGIFLLPSLLPLYQREENLFRSAATLKVIQRHGILDSVIHIDKGSMITTKNLLYDSETGDVLLSRTENEFNDPVYNLSYPSHWAYDAMGLAYKNINFSLQHVSIRKGKILSGLAQPENFFSSGDEIIVAGRLETGPGSGGCDVDYSSFPSYDKIWAIDSSVLNGGSPQIYFVDRKGVPYNGNDIALKVIRSGRRNLLTAVGTVTSLENPLQQGEDGWVLQPGTGSKVLQSDAAEFRQFWQVEDRKTRGGDTSCVTSPPPDCGDGGVCNCSCLATLFEYLKSSRRLFIHPVQNRTVSTLVSDANNAGYSLNINDCPLLQQNAEKLFYARTRDSIGTVYSAQLGDCVVKWNARTLVNFYHLKAMPCAGGPTVYYTDSSYTGNDTLTKRFYTTKLLNRYTINTDSLNLFPYTPPVQVVAANSEKIIAGWKQWDSLNYRVVSFVKFDSLSTTTFPFGSGIVDAKLHLFAATKGFNRPLFPDAHYPALSFYKFVPFVIANPPYQWDLSSTYSELGGTEDPPYIGYGANTSNQNFVFDVKEFVDEWITGTNKGMLFMPWSTLLGTNYAHTTFGSQLDSNVLKRPWIDVRYVGTDSIAQLSVEFCQSCDSVYAESCMSTITDTALNPYVAGILGNWRPGRSYTYYGPRAESDPGTEIHTRTAGTYADFNPFWDFEGGKLLPQYDTTRWVWNSEITLFNRKGFELENRDPLGRYNSGLYGYNLTMPVAVIQNARYRESAFEGFEDYDFKTQVCDTVCAAGRHLDFGAYQNLLDNTRSHSGKSSLRLEEGGQASLSFLLSDPAADSVAARMQFTLTPACGQQALEEIQIDKDVLLPSFSPTKGRRMVLSAWVQEDQDCKCSTYVNNEILIAFAPGDESVRFYPSGEIIEGWQRYEAVFDIPAEANQLTVSLRATSSVSVNFDDLRLHPFNANMKSFVFHPVNLRLMAELDENNYATFYEYDDDGTLIRLKKETQRGIKTIKETRSSLLKE